MNTMPELDIPGPSIPTLLRNLREDTTTLLRQEAALAKAEIGQTARDLGKRSVALVIGGAVCLLGAIALVIGLSQAVVSLLIAADVPPQHASWLGPILVGTVISVIGAICVNRARKALAEDSVQPTQTIASLKETARWAQKKL